MSLTGTTVRNGKWQIAIRRCAGKCRLNKGRIAIDVCHHNDDIARLKLRIGLHHRQQVILQHLHFTLCAVTDLQRDGAIGRIKRALLCAVHQLSGTQTNHRAIVKIQQVSLQVVQQRVIRQIDKCIDIVGG